jgi:beta-lactamase regulating signal transducer with metallopeptidase domain
MTSPAFPEPGAFGVRRAILVLPAGIVDRLTPPQLQAIVAHELCHVRRRDNLDTAVHMAVEALCWFHPLVWWLGARLMEERERACAEEVLLLGNDPKGYAQGILKTCELYLESPLRCVARLTGANLRKRIEIDHGQPRCAQTRLLQVSFFLAGEHNVSQSNERVQKGRVNVFRDTERRSMDDIKV